MLPSLVHQHGVRIMECAPCSLDQWRWRHNALHPEPWSDFLAERALEMAISALAVASASEVLLPCSLLRYVDDTTTHRSGSIPVQGLWRAVRASSSKVAVLLRSADELTHFLRVSSTSEFKKVVLPVPSGPISAKMLFPDQSLNNFYGNLLPSFQDALQKAERDVSWVAWMRSSLSCRFEGAFPAAIRVGDLTAALITSDSCGASQVIWEEGICREVTPRWIETTLKTAAACGVPLNRLGVSFCEHSPLAPACWMKCVEALVPQFVTCSAPVSLFPHSDQRISLSRLQQLTVGYNSVSRISDRDTTASSYLSSEDGANTQLERSSRWASAMQSTWAEIQEKDNGLAKTAS